MKLHDLKRLIEFIEEYNENSCDIIDVEMLSNGKYEFTDSNGCKWTTEI